MKKKISIKLVRQNGKTIAIVKVNDFEIVELNSVKKAFHTAFNIAYAFDIKMEKMEYEDLR